MKGKLSPLTGTTSCDRSPLTTGAAVRRQRSMPGTFSSASVESPTRNGLAIRRFCETAVGTSLREPICTWTANHPSVGRWGGRPCFSRRVFQAPLQQAMNAAHACHLEVRRHLLVGRLDEAERTLAELELIAEKGRIWFERLK